MKNISTKELNYLKDFLSWELLSSKKCYQYAQQETDQQRQQVFIKAASIHEKNYMNLLNYSMDTNSNLMNTSQRGQMN